MRIEYFFDPVCPYCWVTSRWIVDIAPDRDLDVTWRFISLRILNDGNYADKGPAYQANHEKGRELLRVAATVAEDHDADTVGALYTAMGNAIWEVAKSTVGDRSTHLASFDNNKVAGLLSSVGLDPAYTAAMEDDAIDEFLAAETELALERTGGNTGTPVITYGPNGPSFFGPVISTVPAHDDGLRMWDALVELSTVDTFAELKRSKRAPLDLPLLRE